MHSGSIIFKRALLIWPAILFLGCETVVYYNHLAVGQWRIITGRRSIHQIIDDPETGAPLKAKLKTVLSIRNFAGDRLHLPVGDHYLTYLDLKRPYVAWNVFAAPEFSLSPHTWRYPIIGEAAYRGYFAKDAAEKTASRLESQGWDTYVAGVKAYSTLGWFDDAVFSTMLYRKDGNMAAVIFHELAHQKLFVKGDTAFSESFASAVEQEGLRRWLQANHAEDNFQDYLTVRHRHRQLIELIVDFRKRLTTLYQADLLKASKRRLKKKMFESLVARYGVLKSEWNGYDGYDSWFSEPLNNAKLSAISVYHNWVPAFLALLRRHGNDLNAFYEACNRIAAMPASQRHAVMGQILDSIAKPAPQTAPTFESRANRPYRRPTP